jgi:hypothetical protein
MVAMSQPPGIDCSLRIKNPTTEFPQLQQRLVIEQAGCEAFKEIKLNFENEIVSKDRKTKKIEIDQKTLNAYNSCQQALYKSCYPNLQNIEKQKLDTLFDKWKQNPNYRMYDPAVHCLHRASELSSEVSQLGYKSEILIIRSPVLLATIQDNNNKPRAIVDYGKMHPDMIDTSFHAVVEVSVKLADGKVEKRILDPQFADEPMTRESYIKRLTGQDLSKASSNNLFSVYIEELPANTNPYNWMLSKGKMQDKDFFNDPCGWHQQTKVRKELQEFLSPTSPDLQLGAYQPIRGKTDSELLLEENKIDIQKFTEADHYKIMRNQYKNLKNQIEERISRNKEELRLAQKRLQELEQLFKSNPSLVEP